MNTVNTWKSKTFQVSHDTYILTTFYYQNKSLVNSILLKYILPLGSKF